jgi:RimJ/RimL family protein N-acetyltransferase
MSFMGGVRPEASANPALIVRQWLGRWEANGFGHLVIVRRSDAAFLGRVGLAVWDTRDWRIKTVLEAGEHAQPELGWALARAHWGYGYATEAALAARRWARDELRIGRLISVIAPDNTRSHRVAEKLGCVPDKTVVLPDFDRPAVVWEHPSPKAP